MAVAIVATVALLVMGFGWSMSLLVGYVGCGAAAMLALSFWHIRCGGPDK